MAAFHKFKMLINNVHKDVTIQTGFSSTNFLAEMASKVLNIVSDYDSSQSGYDSFRYLAFIMDLFTLVITKGSIF